MDGNNKKVEGPEFEDLGKGFLITCDKNKEKLAVKDSYNFLAEYIEQIYGDLETEQIKQRLLKEGKEVNLQNQLQARSKLKTRVLNTVETNVNCLIFIKISPKMSNIDPNRIVTEIMKDVHNDEKVLTRFCHKILPVQRSFKAEHFKMLDCIDEMFQARDNSEVKSWALNFKCRNNSKFNYKEILGETEKIAKKYGHFVDIYYPQWTVCIEISHHLMCLSIVENYKQFSEFRLHKKMPNINSLNSEKNPNKAQIIKQKKLQKQKQQKNRFPANAKEQKQEQKEKEKEKEKDAPLQNKNNEEKRSQQKQVEDAENEKNVKARLLNEKIERDEDDDVDFV